MGIGIPNVDIVGYLAIGTNLHALVRANLRTVIDIGVVTYLHFATETYPDATKGKSSVMSNDERALINGICAIREGSMCAYCHVSLDVKVDIGELDAFLYGEARVLIHEDCGMYYLGARGY